MKKLTVLSLCLFVCLGLFSQENKEATVTKGVIFDHGTLAESLAKAKKNKKGPKIVFLDCYTTWCGPCKQMSEVVFPMEKMGTFFNANFVNTKIDMEKGEGIDIAKKYSIRAYPTFLILDSDGNEINRIVGSGDADSFIARTKKAMDPNNNPKVKKEAYLANKSSQNAVTYLEALQESYLNTEAKNFIEEEFPAMSPRDKYSDKIWAFAVQSLGDQNSKIFDIVMDEKNVADRMLGKEKIDAAICNALKSFTASYVSGRIQNPDNTKIIAKINYLTLLSNKDETASTFVKVTKLYADNKLDAIAELLKVPEMMRLSQNDRDATERLIMSVKGLPKEKVLEYMKAKADYYKKQAELSEDSYKKSVERMAASSATIAK